MLSKPVYLSHSSGARHHHLIFSSAKCKSGQSIEVNWHELTHKLQMACHKITDNKLNVELFSPWSPPTNANGRTKDCVESSSLLAFDLDKIDVMDIEKIFDWCQPYASFIHTTHSHGFDSKGCFRVYIPLEHSIPIQQYQSVHAAVLETLPEIKSRIDSSSSDIARCFFMPSCPPETKHLAKFKICFSGTHAPTSLKGSIPTNNLPSNIPPSQNLGGRNNGLASYAGKAYALGQKPDEFLQKAIDWGLACNPPMDLPEIESVVDSMWHTHLRNNPFPAALPQGNYLRSADELQNDPPLEWVVRGILPAIGMGAIYGQPSSGKTFLALDLAFAIATGRPWFSNPSIKKPVAYIALEGSHGIRQRITAWELANETKTPSNFKFVTAAVNIEDTNSWQALTNEIKNTLGDGVIVFIDTLNRASPTADENGSASMGKIIESAKTLSDGINGFVMFIHHAGKDANKGMRGHSSLLGALDTVIKVTSGNNQRVWSLEKSKDSEIDKGNAFSLKSVKLQTKDAWGQAHSSCTITQELLITSKPVVKGKNQQQAIATLDAISKDESMGLILQSTFEDSLAKALNLSSPKRGKERAKAAIENLIRSGHLSLINGYIAKN